MGGLVDVVGADHALQRMLPLSSGYVDQVDDGIHALSGNLHLLEVADVADDGILHVRHLMAVKSPQIVPVPESLREDFADGACCPRDQNLHVSCFLSPL